MELDKFIQNFANQFENKPSQEINSELEFKSLNEWDSLQALTIIAMADEEYGITLTGDDIKESKTIEDLFNKIKSKV